MTTKKILKKSNKILGLEKLNNLGINIPKFDYIPDFEDLGFSLVDMNVNYVPEELISILEKKIETFKNQTSYSIRSASFDEDGTSKSSAGRYISFNGLKNAKELAIGAIQIWQHHRQNSKNVKCPLIIQETHPSFFSGVAFKDKNTIIIESYYGACSNIVDGAVRPYMTIIQNDIVQHHFGGANSIATSFVVHKDIFKKMPIESGELIKPKSKTFVHQPRFLSKENGDMIRIYGYRPEKPIKNYEKKIIPQIIDILEKLDNKDGVDIEWGSDADGNVTLYQFRKLSRKILDLNLENKQKTIESNDKQICGIPSSKGIAEGIVENNIEKIDENSILYLKYDNLEDLDILNRVKGIISEQGGILSHLSIICREFGIPCITSIEKPVSVGLKVQINGETGLIEILE